MNRKRLFERVWTKNYLSFFLTLWTALVTLSIAWNLYQDHRGTIEKARIEAGTILQHNLAYRRWNAMHGGVYVQINETTKPNPFIVVPDRDIETTDGRRLTLFNPFMMTKEAYDLLMRQSPLSAVNRTVSLNPLNPENAADEWERTALMLFEKGRRELSGITEINGKSYMRLLKPYITEKGCLKCHGSQGYKVGDIRGGMSIAVPMQPYYELAASTKRIIIISHVFLWLIGATTIVLFSKGMRNYQNTIIENERKFRIVSEFAYNFEFWIKENNEVVFISPSCERITGYSRQEFIDNPGLLTDIIHPDDIEAYRNHLTEFRAPIHEDIEFRIVTKNGQQRWLSHICSPIYVEGKFLGRRGSNRDVTDRKKLEEQLFQSQKMESLGHFACGVAHDFNNLLSAINGCAYMLNEHLEKKDEGLNEFTRQILIASKLGKNLTSNLLAFGRKQIVNPRPVKLSAIITNIADILKTLITEDIELTLSLSEDEVPIFADQHQIEQVIINLSMNAKDAMHQGGNLDIRTSLLVLDKKYPGEYAAVSPGTYMVLSIKDTGSGIDPKHREHIFEPFFSTKGTDKRTGLGLAIVYSIVSQHNGFIDVESELNVGTTFKIFLPISKGLTETSPEGRGDETSAGTPSARNGSETILIVEDEALLRNFLNTFLQRKGYTVILAEDGEEAIMKYNANRNSIDLVILDLVLPRKNGKEVYDEIKAQSPDTKALFISGYIDDTITAAGIHSEGLEFLSKPLDMHAFISKVQSILQRTA